MKAYIGSKIIQAEPMHENEWASKTSKESAGRDGYRVVYPDGYESWSPKTTFEIAYREVTNGEYELIAKTHMVTQKV